jgi:hypothetical protein
MLEIATQTSINSVEAHVGNDFSLLVHLKHGYYMDKHVCAYFKDGS